LFSWAVSFRAYLRRPCRQKVMNKHLQPAQPCSVPTMAGPRGQGRAQGRTAAREKLCEPRSRLHAGAWTLLADSTLHTTRDFKNKKTSAKNPLRLQLDSAPFHSAEAQKAGFKKPELCAGIRRAAGKLPPGGTGARQAGRTPTGQRGEGYTERPGGSQRGPRPLPART